MDHVWGPFLQLIWTTWSSESFDAMVVLGLLLHYVKIMFGDVRFGEPVILTT